MQTCEPFIQTWTLTQVTHLLSSPAMHWHCWLGVGKVFQSVKYTPFISEGLLILYIVFCCLHCDCLGLAAIKWLLTAFETLNLLTYLLQPWSTSDKDEYRYTDILFRYSPTLSYLLHLVTGQVDLKASTVRSIQRNYSVRSSVMRDSVRLALVVSPTLPSPLLDLRRRRR